MLRRCEVRVSLAILVLRPEAEAQSPRIDSVEPSTGSVSGGCIIAIRGAGFRPIVEGEGLLGEYFSWDETIWGPPDFAGREPDLVSLDPQPGFPLTEEPVRERFKDDFAVRWTGTIRVDRAGQYSFVVDFDDGCLLRIDGRIVVASWGGHSQISGLVDLDVGVHPIELIHWEQRGAAGMRLTWIPPGGSETAVPWSRLPPVDSLRGTASSPARAARRPNPRRRGRQARDALALSSGFAIPRHAGGPFFAGSMQPEGVLECFREMPTGYQVRREDDPPSWGAPGPPISTLLVLDDTLRCIACGLVP